MKSFPTQFGYEKNRKIGAAPFYVLKIAFAFSGTYYLSDYAVKFSSWEAGAQTRAWIKSWGNITENIGNEIALTAVSTFSLDMIIDQYANPSIKFLLELSANAVESCTCSLYLAFRDIMGTAEGSSPPQMIWQGNIVDWEYTDELVVRVDMADLSVRMNKYIGTKLSTTTYPDADPSDVGKIYPIVYGADNRVNCLRAVWGARTTLKADITAASTTLYISDIKGFPSSGSIWIDDERITYGSITTTNYTTYSTYRLNSLGRNATGTTGGATAHNSGATVWEWMSAYDSIIAGHALKTIKGTFAKINGELLQVESGISFVTAVDGSSIVRAANNITVKAMPVITDTIAVADTIAVQDTTNVTDPGHTHPVQSSIRRYAQSNTHSSSGTFFNRFTGNDLDMRDGSDISSLKADYTGGTNQSQDTAIFTATFATYTGQTPIKVYAIVTHATVVGYGAPANSGSRIGATWLNTSGNKVTQRIDLNTTTVPASIAVYAEHPVTSGSAYQVTCEIFEIEMEVVVNATSAAVANVDKTGSVAKSGGVAKTGGVTATGVATRLVEYFMVICDGYADTAGGAISGVASGLLTRPDHVMKHFLWTYCSWPLASFYTNFPANGYIFSGVIDQYRQLKSWLAQMAWECRCYFRFSAGYARLLYRADTFTSVKTITSLMTGMGNDYKSTLKLRRSRLEDIINKISLHYNKNSSKSGTDAYESVTEGSDATSISLYGEKEKPELFEFDFVKDSSTAASVRAFYLARYKNRKRVVEMTVFLDNSEIEFADLITLEELTNMACEVQSANLVPGSAKDGRNDKITLVVKEF